MELCRLLDLAAFSGDSSLVHVLIRRGALITDEAMPHAVRSGSIDCVRELLSHPATPQSEGSWLRYPAQCAGSMKRREILSLLVEADGSCFEFGLRGAIKADDADWAVSMLQSATGVACRTANPSLVWIPLLGPRLLSALVSPELIESMRDLFATQDVLPVLTCWFANGDVTSIGILQASHVIDKQLKALQSEQLRSITDCIKRRAETGHTEMIRVGYDLLRTLGHVDAGPNIHHLLMLFEFDDLRTAHHVFSYGGFIDALQFDGETKCNFAPIHLAAAGGNPEMVDLILAEFKGDSTKLTEFRSAQAEGLRGLFVVPRCCLFDLLAALRIAVRRGQLETVKTCLSLLQEVVRKGRAKDQANIAAGKYANPRYHGNVHLNDAFQSYGLAVEGGDLAIVQAFHEHKLVLFYYRIWASDPLPQPYTVNSLMMQQALISCTRRGLDDVVRAVCQFNRFDQWSPFFGELLSVAGQHDRLSVIDCLLELIRGRKLAVCVGRVADHALRALFHSALAGVVSTCRRLIDLLRVECGALDSLLLNKLTRATELLSGSGPRVCLDVVVLLLELKHSDVDEAAFLAAAASRNPAVVRLLVARSVNSDSHLFATLTAAERGDRRTAEFLDSCFLQPSS